MKFRGVYNEDGSVKEWPEFDLMGGVYVKPASTKRLKDPNNPEARSNYFVVLPPRFTDYDRIFTLLTDTEKADAELQAQIKADYERTNAEAIQKEAAAQRAVLGNTARPSVVAPVMMETESKLTRKGVVPNDADA